MLQSGYLNTFVSGEIGPDAAERSDMAQYQSGCAEAFNFVGLAQGPNASRGGFLDVGDAKNQDIPHRKFTWLRGDGEGLVLEFGHLYARIWTARGAKVLTGGGGHVEFTHPFSQSSLPNLRLHQIGDIALVSSRDGDVFQVIKRLSDTSWTCGFYDFRDGPWMPENADIDKELTLTHLGGVLWSIATNFDVFTAAHVGATFRIRPQGGFPGYQSWAPNTAFTAGAFVISAGRVYENTSGATSGNTPPNHDRGVVNDGGIDWTFSHDGAGIVLVTGVTNARAAAVTALTGLPVSTGETTTSWAECAFSGAQGFPTALAAVREERLVLAASLTFPDILHASQTAGFDASGVSFKPGLGTGEVADDDAVRVGVGDKRARIVWMVDGINLIVGTTDAEYIVSGETVEDPLTPAGSKPRRISGHGSSDVMPVVVQGPPILLLHVARGGQTLRELQLSGGVIEPEGRDLSILSQHVFGLGVLEMAWQRPDNILWLRLADDSLAALTYHFEHGVLGVRRQPLAGGWKVEGLATSPDPDGRDRLHVAAYRDKDGSDQRACWVLSPRTAGVFIDSALQYSGSPATTISGLGRLEDEAVTVLADGAAVTGKTVNGGSITLDEPASEVTVGLPLQRRFKTLALDPARDGSATGKKARITHGWVSFRCAEATVSAEPEDDPDETTVYFETISSRRPGDLVPVVRRKRDKVFFGTNADRDVRIVVETAAPFDLIIDAIRYVADVQ